ncbi:MAG: Zn-dependent hydrolase [Anaerolineae bacterium]|nr:Zn-dependent hydrolase [Anaerolineae bacterium]
MHPIKVNQQRLMDDLMALAQITEPNTAGWTRRFPSDAYKRGREWLRAKMENEGMTTRLDAVGNLFGTLNLTGQDDISGLKPIHVGSHTDTVMAAGRFDGMLGVLGGLEAARALREAGVKLAHPLVISDYLSEEATDYAIACMGSLAMCTSDFKAEWLDRTVRGITLRQAIADMGGQPELLGKPLVKQGDIAASLELHIEQGPVLEARQVRLAAVSGIVGIRRAIFELTGKANHAGGTPMNLRQDALAVVGRLICAIEDVARKMAENGRGAVGTIGKIDIVPNQANVIAGKVTIYPEVRSLDMAEVDAMWQVVMDTVNAACAERRVGLKIANETRMDSVVPPTWLHDTVMDVCRRHDPSAIATPSGAGHDSNYLALVAPAVMIFVPSVDGRSHAPEEYTSPEDLALGVQVLAEAIAAVDARA